MAKREYKWDRENLEAGRRRLLAEKENLEENKSAVENLGTEIRRRWQSVSAEIYLDRLEVDVENLNYMIEAIGELSGLLEKVINNAYKNCEEEVNKELRRLRGSIQAL